MVISLRIVFASFTISVSASIDKEFALLVGNDPHSESKAGMKLYFTKSEPILSDLGPEPLSPEFNVQWLHEKCQRTEMPIKLVLLDQTVAAGIGNFHHLMRAATTC